MQRNRILKLFPPILSLSLFIFCCLLLKTTPDRLAASAFCHQIPSRSPAFHFPFCYRCSGLFFGIFFGLIISAVSSPGKDQISFRTLIPLILSVFVYLMDIFNSAKFPVFHLYPETVNYRFLSAFPLGFCMAELFDTVLCNLFGKIDTPVSMPMPIRILLFFAAWGISYLLIFNNSYLISVTSRVLLSLTAVAFLSILYISLAKSFALWHSRPVSTKTILFAGLSCALFQTTLFGFIHLKFLPFEKIF